MPKTKKRLIAHKFKRMGLTESRVSSLNSLNTGDILEFNYGSKHVRGDTGGRKHDPKPALFVFHDDQSNYVEGLNTHYLSYYYISKLLKLLKLYPGIDGAKLYDIVKVTAPGAVRSGYRKYIRSSITPKKRFTL